MSFTFLHYITTKVKMQENFAIFISDSLGVNKNCNLLFNFLSIGEGLKK